MFFGNIFHILDRRIGRNEPVDIVHARIGGGEYSHRATFGEGAHRPRRSHADTDIGAARNYRLDRFTRTLSAEIFQRDAMLLKYPRIYAEGRYLVGPGIDLANSKFEPILRKCA